MTCRLGGLRGVGALSARFKPDKYFSDLDLTENSSDAKIFTFFA